VRVSLSRSRLASCFRPAPVRRGFPLLPQPQFRSPCLRMRILENVLYHDHRPPCNSPHAHISQTSLQSHVRPCASSIQTPRDIYSQVARRGPPRVAYDSTSAMCFATHDGNGCENEIGNEIESTSVHVCVVVYVSGFGFCFGYEKVIVPWWGSRRNVFLSSFFNLLA